MRTTSIISMLKRKGKISNRKSSRIKYKEALEALNAYQNGTHLFVRTIDNKFDRSVSDHCQLEGCNHPIRYEYSLQNKDTKEVIIVGSTCVHVMLGLTEDQKVEFKRVDFSIREFHEMVLWRKSNMDVWDKLMALKKADVLYYKHFWDEVEYAKLHPEDEQYIREVDLDRALKIDADNKARRFSFNNRSTRIVTSTAAPVNSNATPFANILSGIVGTAPVTVPVTTPVISLVANNESITGENDETYDKVIRTLKVLVSRYPQDMTLKSMNEQSNSGIFLTMNQVYRVKVEANKDFYQNKIKGTSEEVYYNNCDDSVITTFKSFVDDKSIRMYSDDVVAFNNPLNRVKLIRKYKQQFSVALEKTDDQTAKFWRYFRIKHEIILK